MAKTVLLQAVCTVVILAAAPVFAQTNMPTGDLGAGGAPNTPTTHEAMPNGTMTPADKMGSPNRPMGGTESHATMDRHSAHRAAMGDMHAMGAMHGRSEASQDAAVDQLNEQSYQAARGGQAFSSTASGTASGAMTAPNGARRMDDMPRGSGSGTGQMGDGGGGGGGGAGGM